MEFCIESMQEDDYWTMKNLLRGYLHESSFDSTEMVDLLIAQREKIGSSITVVGQEEMFGFMSVVDTHEHWEKSSVAQTLKFVLSRVNGSSQFEEWKKVLSNRDSHIGLVLSERIANLPDHLAPHLALLTLNELAQLSPSPQYKYLLVLTSTYKQGVSDEDPNVQDLDEGDAPATKKKKRAPLSADEIYPTLDPTVHYHKIEDEIFKECALLSHSIRIIKYNQQNRWTLRMYTQPSKLFMLISIDQLPRITAKLKVMASDMDADLKRRQNSK